MPSDQSVEQWRRQAQSLAQQDAIWLHAVADPAPDETASSPPAGKMLLGGGLMRPDGHLDERLNASPPEFLQLLPAVPESYKDVLQTIARNGTYINVGCDLTDHLEMIKNLKEQAMTLPDPQLQAQVVFLCNSRLLSASGVRVIANNVVMQDLDVATVEPSRIVTSNLMLERFNRVAGPQVLIIAVSLFGYGHLDVRVSR